MLLILAALVTSAQPIICIDPGHPSEVGRGTQGKFVSEMEVAWQVANLLRAKLSKQGYEVALTKSSLEQKVLNKDRTRVANRSRAALMVRLHCDAAAGSGFTVYYPTQVGTSQGVTGPSKDVLTRSSFAAKKFHAAMARTLSGKLKDNGLRSDLKTNVGAKQGALMGSIFSQVPVLLVEMVVLTNPKDEAFVRSTKGTAALVEALAAGVGAAVPVPRRRQTQDLITPSPR
jgi:N-acetylmuramoyl-L-alanine amidase